MRRRTKEDIPVMHKTHWISNSSLPSYPRSFGETTVDPSLSDIVLIPEDLFEFIYHIGSCFNMHSIIASRISCGRKNSWTRSSNGFYSR